ncbi:MAG: YidC/Oxa1 family membrane protein insertase [Bacillota bacterium]|jgi:YidC/Oxa1 family membrane protein insertase|nr:YidC/Oxa1 family membrane protein insertase [Bacillota bacterium]
MIDAIAEIFGALISFLYSYIPNLGIAIIIMTLIVKLITFPLNNKQIQSSKKMQILQPEMKKIQQKFKDDKEKQNQAMSEFMKENNINPLAGCLPLLIQFPILIGIFRLLREADKFLDMSVINPYLFQGAELIDLLAVPNVGFDNFLNQISIYYIFPLIAGATTYIYSKMSMPSDSSQKMLLYMMPIMITVFSFSFPVGLVIYWTMNNLFSIGQHKFIVRMGEAKEEKISSGLEDVTEGKKDKEIKVEKKSNGKKKSDSSGKAKAQKGKGKK